MVDIAGAVALGRFCFNIGATAKEVARAKEASRLKQQQA
jgi:hypothetical protein